MKLINTKGKDKSGKRAQGADKAKNVLTSDSKFAIVEGYKIARTNLVFSLTAQNSNCGARVRVSPPRPSTCLFPLRRWASASF